MTTKLRIKSILLIRKLRANLDYAKQLGLDWHDKNDK